MTNEAEERARYIENLKSLGHRNIPINQDGFFLDMYQRFRWEGWQARAASPVSAPTGEYDQKACDVIKNLSILVRRLCHRVNKHEPNCKMVDQALAYLRGEGLQGSILRDESVAPVSAEQPTRTFAEAINLGRESWQAKHGKCSMCALGDVPVDGLHRGKHKCGNDAGSPFIPRSEDWMRKAAESSAYKLYPPTKYCTDNATRCNAEAIIREEIAKHYAASQLSVEEKVVGKHFVDHVVNTEQSTQTMCSADIGKANITSLLGDPSDYIEQLYDLKIVGKGTPSDPQIVVKVEKVHTCTQPNHTDGPCEQCKKEKYFAELEIAEAHLAEQALRWYRAFEMYRTAWLREMGGVIRPKWHEIDGFVLRMRDIYEKAKLVDRIRQIMVTELKRKGATKDTLFDVVFRMLAEDGHDEVPTN